jgi:hypothetical protein
MKSGGCRDAVFDSKIAQQKRFSQFFENNIFFA